MSSHRLIDMHVHSDNSPKEIFSIIQQNEKICNIFEKIYKIIFNYFSHIMTLIYLTDKHKIYLQTQKVFRRRVKQMSKNGSSKGMVPEARDALDRFKMEAAAEVGVDLKQGYNGHLTSREAGSVGGQMVKKMIESYERNMK